MSALPVSCQSSCFSHPIGFCCHEGQTPPRGIPPEAPPTGRRSLFVGASAAGDRKQHQHKKTEHTCKDLPPCIDFCI